MNKHVKQLRKAGCEVTEQIFVTMPITTINLLWPYIAMICKKVVVISPDSCLVHKTWAHASTEDGGLGGIHFPMMEVTLPMMMMLRRLVMMMMTTMMIMMAMIEGYSGGACQPAEHLG